MQNAIFCGSTRSGGNSEFATKLILETLGSAEIHYVARANIQGCLACSYCAKHYGQCVLSLQTRNTPCGIDVEANKGIATPCLAQSTSVNIPDMADFYFQKLFTAEHIFFVSPIYLYNVPAQLKAFLDRTQAWYFKPTQQKDKNSSLNNMNALFDDVQKKKTQKKCGLILIAAREQGEKLFDGASLTFKYALNSLGFSVATPLCLYGLDQRNDLARNNDYHRKITEYVENYRDFPVL